MNLAIMGFLPDDNEDELIKYYADISQEFEKKVLHLVEQNSLREMAGSDWPLTADQARQISSIINENLPIGLDFFLTVVP